MKNLKSVCKHVWQGGGEHWFCQKCKLKETKDVVRELLLKKLNEKEYNNQFGALGK